MSLFESYNKFLFIQCRFSKDVCDNVFGDLSNHLYNKWDSSCPNVIDFLSCLDPTNKQKLFEWVETSINKENE